LEGLGIESVVIFFDHVEYFTAIWYTLQPFDIGCGHLVHFFRFGMFGPRKIWQTCKEDNHPIGKISPNLVTLNMSQGQALIIVDYTGETARIIHYNSAINCQGLPCNPSSQGCQMVYFQTKNSYLGKFWSVLQ
jgi:hypothetical protein